MEEHALRWEGDLKGQIAFLSLRCGFNVLNWSRNHHPRVRLGEAPWEPHKLPWVPGTLLLGKASFTWLIAAAELLRAGRLHSKISFEGKDSAFASAEFPDVGLVACRRGCRSCSALIWRWKENVDTWRNAALEMGKSEGEREGKSVQRLSCCVASLNACFTASPGMFLLLYQPTPAMQSNALFDKLLSCCSFNSWQKEGEKCVLCSWGMLSYTCLCLV